MYTKKCKKKKKRKLHTYKVTPTLFFGAAVWQAVHLFIRCQVYSIHRIYIAPIRRRYLFFFLTIKTYHSFFFFVGIIN